MTIKLNISQVKTLIGKYGVASATALTDSSIHSRVQEYRRTMSGRMTPVEKQNIRKRIPAGEFYVSRKIDGEFAVLYAEDNEIFLINPGGTIRIGLPLLQEASYLLKKSGISQALFAGEFYYLHENRRPRVHDVVRVARKPDSEADIQRLYFAVFDVIEIDSSPLETDFHKKWERINSIFSAGKQIHPVETLVVKDIKGIEEAFEKWVEQESGEGVVARSDNAGIFKIKPRHNFDVAVVGFTEGTEDRQGMLHDMLVAVMREEGTFHLLGRVGGGFTDTERSTFLSDLKDITAESEYHEINADHISYQMVRPEWVIEISCLDLIPQSSRGGNVDRMVLNWNASIGKYETVRQMPLCAIISPQFIRRRDDKTVNTSDVRLKQISDIVDIPDADKNSLQITLPKSSILKREVCVKSLKGANMVRKLLMWKTNKETEENFPAYVIYFTDFSPNRKDPLNRDIRVSNSKEQIEAIWEDMKTKYFVKGWKPVQA